MSIRFTFPGKFAVRPVKDGKGSLRAYLTIVDNLTGLEYRDVRLIQGKNGYFVAAPYRAYEKDGETQYAEFWRASYDEASESRSEKGDQTMREMTAAAVAAYEAHLGGGSVANRTPAEAPAPARTSTRRTARGPAPLVGADDIPF